MSLDKDENIKVLIQERLVTEVSMQKYLDILAQRIDENRKTINRLFIILLFTSIAFPLLLEAKISEISLDPLKLVDNRIAIVLVPSIFIIVYYKYLMIWYNLVEQKRTFKLLTSEIFNLEIKSFLNEQLAPFSIVDSIGKHHSNDKHDFFSCLTSLILIPIGFVVIFFPFVFEGYLIIKVFEVLKPNSFLNWILFIIPIIISVCTLLMMIEVVRKDFKDLK